MLKPVGSTMIVLGLLSALGAARADPRDNIVKEFREEVGSRHMTCMTPSYLDSDRCGNEQLCKATLEAITDLTVGLDDSENRSNAVRQWQRYISRRGSTASCASALLSSSVYCSSIDLIKAFDPHEKCPESGATNTTCWLNERTEAWIQNCKIDE